jgi:hypothetical protein
MSINYENRKALESKVSDLAWLTPVHPALRGSVTLDFGLITGLILPETEVTDLL